MRQFVDDIYKNNVKLLRIRVIFLCKYTASSKAGHNMLELIIFSLECMVANHIFNHDYCLDSTAITRMSVIWILSEPFKHRYHILTLHKCGYFHVSEYTNDTIVPEISFAHGFVIYLMV